MWIAAWIGLFLVMHTPVPAGAVLFNYADLIIHFCAYFTLALIGSRSALSRQVKLTPRWLITWIVVYVVYGAADELLQGPVNRHPSIWDWAADAVGAVAALGMAYVNRPEESGSGSS